MCQSISVARGMLPRTTLTLHSAHTCSADAKRPNLTHAAPTKFTLKVRWSLANSRSDSHPATSENCCWYALFRIYF